MNQDQVVSLLDSLGVSHNISWTPKWASFSCPFAPWLHPHKQDRHPSFGIRYSVAEPYFNCYTCQCAGNLRRFVELCAKFLGTSPTVCVDGLIATKLEDLFPVTEIDEEVEMIYPEEYLDYFLPVTHAEHALKYVKSRRITEDLIDLFEIKYDPEKDLVVIPVRYLDGSLRGAVGRAPSKERRFHNYWEFLSGANIGGVHLLQPDITQLIIVEGFFDVLRIYPWVAEIPGAGVVCTFKAKMSAGQAAIISNYDAVKYCGYDNDAAGETGYQSMISYFGTLDGYSLRRMCHPAKDFGESTKREFLRLFKAAREEWALV